MQVMKHFGWTVAYNDEPLTMYSRNIQDAIDFVAMINKNFDGMDVKVVELFFEVKEK